MNQICPSLTTGTRMLLHPRIRRTTTNSRTLIRRITYMTKIAKNLTSKSTKHGAETLKDQVVEFCRYCGASIPHRPGEGRCPKCSHHERTFCVGCGFEHWTEYQDCVYEKHI